MTTAEAAEVLEIRAAMWPSAAAHVDPVTEIRVWAKLLADFPVERVLGAVESFSGEFAPTLPQVREVLDPRPTFETALTEFKQMHARGYSTQRWSEVPWSHPLIAAFAERHFGEWGRSPDGVADPSLAPSEAAARAHLRGSFASTQRQFVAGQLNPSPYQSLESGQQIEGRTDVGAGSRGLQLVRSPDAVGVPRGDGEQDPG